jgi:hypothetical protein
MGDCPSDTVAIGFDRVFGYGFRFQRRQLAVPVDDL